MAIRPIFAEKSDNVANFTGEGKEDPPQPLHCVSPELRSVGLATATR